MASIKKRPDGKWRARYRDPAGREHSRHFDRKVDAETWLTAQESSKLSGAWVDPALGKTRVDEWAWQWLASVSPALKPSTVEGYKSLLRSRVIPELGSYWLAQLRPSDVQSWLGRLEAAGLSASRIRKAHIVLSQALEAAMRDQRVARNVARGVKLPRVVRREAPYFEPESVERIAAAMTEPNDLLIRLLGTLGLRWGEAAALERRSVDLLRSRLVIEASLSEVAGRLVRTTTKTHATRSIPLPAGLAAEFEHHLAARVGSAPGSALFTGPDGGHLRHSAFYNRVWRPALAELGLPPVGLHVLRHSAAARLISAGATPKAVQVVLGHGSAAPP